MKVCTWTVDRAPVMAALAAAGVDAIISNDLDMLRHTLGRADDDGPTDRPIQVPPPRRGPNGACLDSPA